LSRTLFAALGSAAFIIIGGSTALGWAELRANRGTMSNYLPPIVPAEQRTLSVLAGIYKTDPFSRYQTVRFCTRQNFDSQLSRLLKDYGDSRSGAITEAFSLNANASAVRKMATHSQQSQTDAYNRGDADAIAEVMRGCALNSTTRWGRRDGEHMLCRRRCAEARSLHGLRSEAAREMPEGCERTAREV
jgi:hypothetical protein